MRATFLQFRNPKEETPGAYYPQKTNNGRAINRFVGFAESESNQGTFSKNTRFNQGSIYKNVVDRTAKSVGPGTYKEETVVHNLKKKPCMTTIRRPEIGENEGPYEMQGHTRILQVNYLPKPRREEFKDLVKDVQGKFGRKMNDMIVYQKAYRQQDQVHSQLRAVKAKYDSHKQVVSSLAPISVTPVISHVSRIRNCYRQGERERELQQVSRFYSPGCSMSRSTLKSPNRGKRAGATLQAKRVNSLMLDTQTQSSGTVERPITAPDTAAHSVTLDSNASRSFNRKSSSGITDHPQTSKNRRRRRIQTLEVASEDPQNDQNTGDPSVLAIDQPGRFVIHNGAGQFAGGHHQRYSSWSQIQNVYLTAIRPQQKRKDLTPNRYGAVDGSARLDGKRKFMRDIMCANSAVEVAMSSQNEVRPLDSIETRTSQDLAKIKVVASVPGDQRRVNTSHQAKANRSKIVCVGGDSNQTFANSPFLQSNDLGSKASTGAATNLLPTSQMSENQPNPTTH